MKVAWKVKAIAALFVVVLIGAYAVSDYTYSEGMRQGTISKFSRKGIVCKTWEGELAMANFSKDGRAGREVSVEAWKRLSDV